VTKEEDMDDVQLFVKQIRALSSKCNGVRVLLPSVMVAVINNDQPEVDWKWIDVDKVLHYISDMVEE